MTDPTPEPIRFEQRKPQQGPGPAVPPSLPAPPPLTFEGRVPGAPAVAPPAQPTPVTSQPWQPSQDVTWSPEAPPPVQPQPVQPQPVQPPWPSQPLQHPRSPYAVPGVAVHGHPHQPYGGHLGNLPKRTNGLAIASMVISVTGLVLACVYIGLLAGPVAAILGHVARKKIKETGAKGAGLALTGIILGWVLTALLVLVTIGLTGRSV